MLFDVTLAGIRLREEGVTNIAGSLVVARIQIIFSISNLILRKETFIIPHLHDLTLRSSTYTAFSLVYYCLNFSC